MIIIFNLTTPEGDAPRALLVVDDDPDIRFLIRLHLERAGYTVREAVDGADALTQLESGDIDGVVLDLRMPRVDGYEVLERLRERGQLERTPVLTVSAHADDRTVTELADLGTRGHVHKPFTTAQLLDAVDALFDDRVA